MERMILDGDLHADQRVFDPDASTWRPAGEIDALRPAFQRRQELQSVHAAREESTGPSQTPAPTDSPPTATGRLPRAIEPVPPGAQPQVAAPVPEHTDQEDPTKDVPAAQLGPDDEPLALGIEHLEVLDDLGPENLDPALVVPIAIDEASATPPSPAGDPPSCPKRPLDDDSFGQVILFPQSRRGGGQRSDRSPLAPDLNKVPTPIPLPELNLHFPELATRTPTKQPPITKSRLGLIAVTLVMGLSSLYLFQYYVNNTLSAGSVAEFHGSKTQAAGTSRGTTSGGTNRQEEVETPLPVDPAAPSPYDQLEDDLRERMVPGIVPVTGADGLESSLLVELSRLHIDVIRIQAPVLEWGGRRQEMPVKAEIKIWYLSREGELDRELGAIGLVVGKYLRHYSLDVPLVDVIVQTHDEQTFTRKMDPASTQAFYLQRLSMYDFLSGA